MVVVVVVVGNGSTALRDESGMAHCRCGVILTTCI